MRKYQIRADLFNDSFREVFKDFFYTSKENMRIISPDLETLFNAIGIIDLQDMMYDRKIKNVEIYTTWKTKPSIRNYPAVHGHRIFVGLKEVDSHYLIADTKNFIEAKEADRKMVGSAHYDDKNGASRLVEMFNSLVSDANTHEHKFDKTLDPLYKLLYQK